MQGVFFKIQKFHNHQPTCVNAMKGKKKQKKKIYLSLTLKTSATPTQLKEIKTNIFKNPPLSLSHGLLSRSFGDLKTP